MGKWLKLVESSSTHKIIRSLHQRNANSNLSTTRLPWNMKASKDKQIGVEIKSYQAVAVQIWNINQYGIFVRRMKSEVYFDSSPFYSIRSGQWITLYKMRKPFFYIEKKYESFQILDQFFHLVEIGILHSCFFDVL